MAAAKHKTGKRKEAHDRQAWERPPPKKAKHTHLSGAEKTAAKARAKRAGRAYPNLVDNMRASKSR